MFRFFYYENFDALTVPTQDNPRHVLRDPAVHPLIHAVATSEPGKYTCDTLQRRYGHAALILALIRIGVFAADAGGLRLAAPCFLARDCDTLAALTKRAGQSLAAGILNCREALYAHAAQIHNGQGAPANLYHLLCGRILDGLFFDALEARGLVTVSKVQPTGLDYLIVLYEEDPRLTAFSNRLLCSYNRWGNDAGTFESFGDADGLRVDLFRFFRLLETGQLSDTHACMRRCYEALTPGISSRDALVSAYKACIYGQAIVPEAAAFFESAGYLMGGKVCVPVFDNKVCDPLVAQLYACIEPYTLRELADTLGEISHSGSLTALKHGVPTADVANEVYHLIFGQANEALIQAGLAKTPRQRPGEGRYEQAFSFTNK